MDPKNIHDLHFEEYFSQLLKDRGVNLKKLSELSGISEKHLQALANGNFENLPSTPYVYGYFTKLGEVLNFDPGPWWIKLKASGFLKDSGTQDIRPKNRFLKSRNLSKIAWASAGTLIVILYLVLRFGLIFGTPKIDLIFPLENPARTDTNTINLVGRLTNGTGLYVNGELVFLTPEGNWNKSILLEPGMNTVMITAKKFLGGEAKFVEAILYEPPASAPAPANTATTTRPAK